MNVKNYYSQYTSKQKSGTWTKNHFSLTVLSQQGGEAHE